MKKYNLEKFLVNPRADVGTGVLVSRGFGFCFVLKQPHRWGKDEKGTPVLPFGGIGGKLEENELPSACVRREAIEEVGSDLEIIEIGKKAILMDQKVIQKISLSTSLEEEPLPIIIFRSPRAEVGRKPFTNVLIYLAKFISKEIQPIDDPALIELNSDLLIKMVKNPITVEEFQKAGGRITSRIDLPKKGFLKPIGTAFAAARCLEEGLINNLI